MDLHYNIYATLAVQLQFTECYRAMITPGSVLRDITPPIARSFSPAVIRYV